MIGIPAVDYHTNQPIDIEVIVLLHKVSEIDRARFVFHLAYVLTLVTILERIWSQVQNVWDVQLRVHLYILE